jgi:hypothetical protein
MRTFRMGSVAALLLTLCAARPAAAQQLNFGADTNRATIMFGVSLLHETYGSGWGGEMEVSGSRTWSPLRMGWVVEGGVNVFDGFSEWTAMGGVRFGPRQGAVVRPFGKFMAGLQYCHACKTTDPTFEPAAGVDVAVGHSRRVAIRGLVGYRITPSERRTFKEVHVQIGVTFALGAPR